MKKEKRYWIILSAFILVLCIAFASVFSSASLNVKKFSLKKTYSPYEFLSGTINLTITDEKIDSGISSNLGDSMSFRDFLDLNEADYSCSNEFCEIYYSYSGENSEKTISISNNNKSYFGFVLFGNEITDIEILKFNVSSNFDKSSSQPLKMEFFDSAEWNFDKTSDDYSRAIITGCYQSGALTSNVENTMFCEKMEIPETSSLKIGAQITGTDNKNLTMAVYDEFETEIASCKFLPPEDSCIAEPEEDETFPAGDYYVCLTTSQKTNYKILKEQDSKTCGWAQSSASEISVPGTFSKDFAIFAKVPKFAPASMIDFNSDDLELAENAMNYIDDYYSRDCSEGCVLPVSAEGISQNLKVSNIYIKYRDEGDLTENRKVYLIEPESPDFVFSGTLDLNYLKFSAGGVGKKKIELKFGGNKLLSEDIEVVPAPIIKSVYPRNPAAGVETTFSIDVESKYNVTSYSWDFGDNETKQTTTKNFATHLYEDTGLYKMTVEATDSKGMKTTKEFLIIAGSPESTINQTIAEKRSDLIKATNDINGLSSWYKDKVKKIAQIDFYSGELDRIQRGYNNAFEEEDFLELALELLELNVPKAVFISEKISSPLIINIDDIDPEPVRTIAGGVSGEDLEEYKNPIWNWQKDNIEATVQSEKVSAVSEKGAETLITIYTISLKSSSGEGEYFIINKPIDELFFDSSTTARKADDSSVIAFEGETNIRFYIEGEEDMSFFVSPKLSLLETSAPVGECNFNKVCEKEKGETYENCRSDCKPWGWAIFYLILIIIGGLAAYTLLQVWYKKRYETFLFKNRNYLFNLVSFITNAKANGKSEAEIRKILLDKRWSNEQITYALKKEAGKRTGMFEIIPVEKIFAYFRRKNRYSAPAPYNRPYISGYSTHL